MRCLKNIVCLWYAEVKYNPLHFQIAPENIALAKMVPLNEYAPAQP